MTSTLKATFATRRDAELAIERLVQEHGVNRSNIAVAPEGAGNSAGDAPSGSDQAAASPTVEARDDAALEGRIGVSVDLRDEAKSSAIRAAFAEFAGST
ncbi:hypothetical protein BH10PSE1_BH10PSE1_13350 [soil metagenome]